MIAGAGGGRGVLTYRGHDYSFRVSGLSLGVSVGASVMRLTGRVVGATQFLQVVSVQSVIKGKLHDVYYWCDVCSITTYEPGNCPCCGDPTVLKEEPVK